MSSFYSFTLGKISHQRVFYNLLLINAEGVDVAAEDGNEGFINSVLSSGGKTS